MATVKKAAPAKPFLDLDALVEKRQNDPDLPVRLNGIVYAMSTQADLGIATGENLRRAYGMLAQIRDSDASEDGFLSAENSARVEAIHDRICRMILPDVPAEVMTDLDPRHKAQIANWFVNHVDQTPFLDRVMHHLVQRIGQRQQHLAVVPDAITEAAA